MPLSEVKGCTAACKRAGAGDKGREMVVVVVGAVEAGRG
jgi:hypothetical protein